MPAITYSWMTLLAYNQIQAIYSKYTVELDKYMVDNKSGDPFPILADLHGIISGFKALSTWDGEKYSEILKQACGGHGFMHISGLSRIHTDFGFGF